ncbi:MAG TPA: sugar phosphate isomerase/epimerase family protein [Spirochaetia bacterium]|nr:sugar phosphate isomerase/epimerase family protein [Spirochaetia bacterium]
MNRVGIYYAYWTHDWDADFVPFVTRVKRLGFDALEVNSGTVAGMTRSHRERLRSAAQDEGVALSSCIGLPAKFDPSSADLSVRRRGVRFLAKQIEAAAATGISAISGILYGAWPAAMPAGETDKRPYWDRSVKSMREACRVAADRGVCLNMEVVNRFEQFLLNTAVEAVRYATEVGSPACRILLDTFHMNIEEDGFRSAIRAAGPRLGHVHLGETNRRPPGRGKMPWGEIFGALRSIGYRGSLVMEPFLMPGGEVGRDIRVYRDLRDGKDLDREAARACRFVRAGLSRQN